MKGVNTKKVTKVWDFYRISHFTDLHIMEIYFIYNWFSSYVKAEMTVVD